MADVRVSAGADLVKRQVVHVATTQAVKGLEYDGVVLVDGVPGKSRGTWWSRLVVGRAEKPGEGDEARRRRHLRRLYVAITRPCVDLAIVAGDSVSEWQAILNEAKKA